MVEDDPRTVEAVQVALADAGYTVCGHADRGEGVTMLMQRQRPSVVLMDIALRGCMDGIDAARSLRQQRYDGALIYLTGHATSELFERARSTRPHAYLLKPFTARQLVVALEVATARRDEEAVLRQELQRVRTAATRAHGLLDAVLQDPALPRSEDAAKLRELQADIALLSDRELDVFERAVRGESLEELASALFISRHTARNHLAAIYRKLGVTSRLQLSTTYMDVLAEEHWRDRIFEARGARGPIHADSR